MLEVKWYGRGGQGAKTAALLLGEALMHCGKYVQAFPEFGPERMGAPVTAFNRISDEPILLHCAVRHPDIVIILDETLIPALKIHQELKPNGMILVNTKKDKVATEKLLMLEPTHRLFTIDATGIALDQFGRNLPNTPMLGALIKITNLVGVDEFIGFIKERLLTKFKTKPSIVDANIKAMKFAYEQVT